MSYRDLVEDQKQANIDLAREHGRRVSEIDYWDTRRVQLSTQVQKMVHSTVEELLTGADARLMLIAKSVRADMFGIAENDIRMPSTPDAVDAGPEHKLLPVLQAHDIEIHEQRLTLRLGAVNTIYKITKWESLQQLEHLQSTLKKMSHWELSAYPHEIVLLRGTSAYCQACLETDIETKPHLKYAGNYAKLQKQFAKFETLELPFRDME